MVYRVVLGKSTKVLTLADFIQFVDEARQFNIPPDTQIREEVNAYNQNFGMRVVERIEEVNDDASNEKAEG